MKNTIRFRYIFGTKRHATCPACKATLPREHFLHGVCSSEVCQEDATLARGFSFSFLER
jgi:hypothetical protein